MDCRPLGTKEVEIHIMEQELILVPYLLTIFQQGIGPSYSTSPEEEGSALQWSRKESGVVDYKNT